jgi:hypothetical protein
MADFITTLRKQVLLGDGAMGTMLAAHGLPPGENPELWMLSHPRAVQEVHRAYFEAGSQVILTNTLGASALKLKEYGAVHLVEEVNKRAAQLVREVVGNQAFVAGVIGPTGQFPAPLGTLPWTELVEVFGEQAQGTCGHPPEYFGNPGNRTGTIDSDQPGVFTSFGAGRFQEEEGPGDRAVEGGPDNYTAIKLNCPVSPGQRLTRF